MGYVRPPIITVIQRCILHPVVDYLWVGRGRRSLRDIVRLEQFLQSILT